MRLLMQAGERERDGVCLVQAHARTRIEACQTLDHPLHLFFTGVAAAGQTLFDGGRCERQDWYSGFLEYEADRTAHVRHQQCAPGMPRRGEDFFECDEVWLELGDDCSQAPRAGRETSGQGGIGGWCDDAVTENGRAHTTWLEHRPTGADEPGIDAERSGHANIRATRDYRAASTRYGP